MKSKFCNPFCEGCSVDPSFDIEAEGESEHESLVKERRKMVYKKGESIFTEGSKPSGALKRER